MDNKELLLMGGGKSYFSATHWLTVGKGINKNSNQTLYGFCDNSGTSTTTIGDLQPRTIDAYTIFEATASDSDTILYMMLDSVPKDITFVLTLLEIDVSFEVEVTSDNKLSVILFQDPGKVCASYFSSNIGRTVPLEFIAYH